MEKRYRSTEELENLGWLKRPTAKEFFLQNPNLIEQYKTYDNYASTVYAYAKPNWVNGSVGQSVADAETKRLEKAHGVSSINYSIQDQIREDFEYLNISTQTLDTLDESIKNFAEGKVGDAIYTSNVKVKKLKYKKKKEFKLVKKEPTTCPYCLSLLKSNEVKVLECTGDKLRIWEVEFLKFNKLNQEQRNKYLIGISNRDMFIDLYEKWSVIDEKGQRPNFTCGYSNRIFNPISRYRLSIPDPLLIKAIERSLGRELTEEEKFNEKELWQYQGRYSDRYKKGANKVRIPQVVFPEGFV